MNKAYWTFFVTILAIIALGSYDFLSGLKTDVYHGRIVDEQTGQPLVGAVVTVVWYRTPLVQMGGSKYFLSAQETETDTDGRFSLKVSPGLDWDWSTARIKEPAIIFYYAGYEPNWPDWMVRWGFPKSSLDLGEALKKGYVAQLRKLKTKEEMLQFADSGYLPLIRVPTWAIPKLLASINEQRKSLGLHPFS